MTHAWLTRGARVAATGGDTGGAPIGATRPATRHPCTTRGGGQTDERRPLALRAELPEGGDLTDSQRAMVAARLATLQRGANQHTPTGGSSLTQEQAANRLGVGERTLDPLRRSRRAERERVLASGAVTSRNPTHVDRDAFAAPSSPVRGRADVRTRRGGLAHPGVLLRETAANAAQSPRVSSPCGQDERTRFVRADGPRRMPWPGRDDVASLGDLQLSGLQPRRRGPTDRATERSPHRTGDDGQGTRARRLSRVLARVRAADGSDIDPRVRRAAARRPGARKEP